jgi:hypothetical protein
VAVVEEGDEEEVDGLIGADDDALDVLADAAGGGLDRLCGVAAGGVDARAGAALGRRLGGDRLSCTRFDHGAPTFTWWGESFPWHPKAR